MDKDFQASSFAIVPCFIYLSAEGCVAECALLGTAGVLFNTGGT